MARKKRDDVPVKSESERARQTPRPEPERPFLGAGPEAPDDRMTAALQHRLIV